MQNIEYTQMAEVYDALYKNKNYKKEVEFIKSFLPNKNAIILDAGCGTGNHAALLYQQGYNVFGFDASCQMVAEANKKIPNCFEVGNLLNYSTEEKYDCIYSFFAVFNHLKTYRQFEIALENLKKLLNKNDKIIIDLHNPQKSGSKIDKIDNITRIMRWKKLNLINYEYSKIIYLINNKKYKTYHIFKIFKIKKLEKLAKKLNFKSCNFYENYNIENMATNKSKNIQVILEI